MRRRAPNDKMYDRCGIALCIGTTTNEVFLFQYRRKQEYPKDRPPRERGSLMETTIW